MHGYTYVEGFHVSYKHVSGNCLSQERHVLVNPNREYEKKDPRWPCSMFKVKITVFWTKLLIVGMGRSPGKLLPLDLEKIYRIQMGYFIVLLDF